MRNGSPCEKMLQVIGSFDNRWEDVSQVAIYDARKTIYRITGLEITDMTAMG
jgi:flavin-binding protein dodecin